MQRKTETKDEYGKSGGGARRSGSSGMAVRVRVGLASVVVTVETSHCR